MSHGGSANNNQGQRGADGNYHHQGGQQYHQQGSNDMQYNYAMNQPYGGQGGYQEQFYPQEGYEYGADGFEEADYDNLDEIDRVRNCISSCTISPFCVVTSGNISPATEQALNTGESYDYEADMAREMEAMSSPSYGQHQQQRGFHQSSPRTGPYVPQSAVPSQNGKLSSHAHEFWFPEARNCPCCKGFKHGCGCCKNGVDTCRDAACIDSAFANQVSAELASRPAGAPAATSAPAAAGNAPIGHTSAASRPAPAAASGSTEFCKYESSPGGCRFGATCRFPHSAPAMSSPAGGQRGGFNSYPPPAAGGGPPKCIFFARGTCQHGEKCRFSHTL
jgi:hypothetical protein